MGAGSVTSVAAAVVELAGVGKLYGAHWAVRGVTLTIAAGEFFTLLGPSGCGKTTVLRMIAGFAEPDLGEIRLDGKPVAGVPPWRSSSRATRCGRTSTCSSTSPSACASAG
jgi:ABC-type Fe3+/spermidine/putrescine transport system ATPase subunit